MYEDYCHCFVPPDDGRIIGCHLSLINDCCGGYITDTMLEKIRNENR